MPNFDDPETLDEEARSLLREDSTAGAALTWAKSREAALTLGDNIAAFKAGVWEVHARAMSGELQKCQDMVFLLFVAPPEDAPPYEWWILHVTNFEIQRSLRPDHARLKSLISDLDTLSVKLGQPVSDVNSIKGDFEYLRGNWERALDQYTRAWHSHAGVGFIPSGAAFKASLCCFILGRIAEASSWRQHLSVTDQDDWEPARQKLKTIAFLLSLEAGDRAAVHACVENGCGGDECEMRGRLFLRGESTDSLDDPADPAHPARKLAVLKRTDDVHDRFSNLLALVDYRLACLRFTAGLAAVDDYYYRRPDVLPRAISLTNPARFRHQLHLFGISWRLLDRLARRIDGWLECDWRTKEAIARRQRCDAIVAVCITQAPSTIPP